MSHQSGITAEPLLEKLLGQFQNDASKRMLQILIHEEQMTVGGFLEAEGDEREDYDEAVLSMIEDKKCCFIIYRLDSKSSNGFDFLFISYSPDFAHVREKMLYASTRATLKTLFGNGYIKWEVFGTVPDDVSLEGFDKHVASENAPAPLTMEEHEKAEIKELESGADIGASTKKALVATGVSFPISEEGIAAIKQLMEGAISYVQLELDLKAEVTNLATSGQMTVEEAAATIPEDMARYNIFNFDHNHEGDELSNVVFLYSCPSFKMKVKARMLYASGKQPLVDFLESEEMGLFIDKKAEIEDATEFTHEYMYDMIHPPKTITKQKFARPKGPAGRKGTKRMTSRGASGGASAKSGAAGGVSNESASINLDGF